MYADASCNPSWYGGSAIFPLTGVSISDRLGPMENRKQETENRK